MLYVEIQQGKEPMTSEKYGKFAAAIGVTAAFVKRRVAATAHGGSKLSERRDAKKTNKVESYAGDSWFSSVKAALATQEQGHEYFGPIKTNTSGFPQGEMNKWMESWPSGSYIVLECKQQRLFAVGYRYSLRSKGMSFSSVLLDTILNSSNKHDNCHLN